VKAFARLWILGGCPTPTLRDYLHDEEEYPGWWSAVHQIAYEIQSAEDVVKATADTVKSNG
jgi:hypothetical protein